MGSEWLCCINVLLECHVNVADSVLEYVAMVLG